MQGIDANALRAETFVVTNLRSTGVQHRSSRQQPKSQNIVATEWPSRQCRKVHGREAIKKRQLVRPTLIAYGVRMNPCTAPAEST